MFCQKCGTEVPDDASFCGSCGHDLGVTTPLAALRDVTGQNEIDLVRAALHGDYEILEELGRGGMAIVYRAREIMLDREVAIKVLPFSLAFDREFVERFQREARTSARLEHPNIIPIYRVGKTDNVIYFAMKFLRGKSLADIIADRGRLPAAQIRQLLIETGGALGYAHQHGIVHRDIKPDNIMFKESGQAVLCDFGIAKAASGTRLTGTGMAIGTPYYMSPEQARAQALDGRSDLYSLGVVAYQCLTGNVPFDGEDSFAIGYKHIMEELPQLELTDSEERALDEVIRKMMAKDPADRYQKAEDLVMLLSDGGPTAAILPPIVSQKTTPMQSMPGVAVSEEETAIIVSTPIPPTSGSAGSSGIIPPPQETGRETGAPTPTGPGPSGTSAGSVGPAVPPTPTTPMPRASTESPGVTPARRRRTGVLVGMLVVLVGGGVGGGYYYTQVAGGVLPFFPTPDGSEAATPATSEASSPGGPGPGGNAPLARSDGEGDPGTLGALPAAGDSTGVDVDPRADSTVELPARGVLALSNMGRNARLFIDGRPARGSEFSLPPGPHTIRVERSGYRPYRRTLTVAAGDTLSHRVTLARLPKVSRPPPDPTPVPAEEPPASQCTAFDDTYNVNGECFDSTPRLPASVSPFVALDATVPRRPTRPAILVVQVRPDGSAATILPKDPTDVPQFAILAVAFAKNLTYQPARKNGQPVMAWAQFVFYPQ